MLSALVDGTIKLPSTIGLEGSEMKTEGIGITNPYANNKVPSPPAKPGKVFDTTAADIFKAPVDTYTPSVQGAANPEKVEELWKETNHMGDAIRQLIESAIGVKSPNGQGFWAKRAQNIKLSEADRAKAQELISEDGYFGVKKTSERLIEFAKALVGENASEKDIELMRNSVQKGFDEVAKMFGGFDKLPQVTKDTYEAVMKQFDEWAGKGAEAAAAADTE